MAAKRWDDIEILRAIDRHQETHGGARAWATSGYDLMQESAGEMVAEQHRWRGFIQELHNIRDGGLVTFTVDKMVGGAPPNPDANPEYYLQQVRNFALTVAGQDRARGQRVTQPLPEPNEDDGRPISHLVLQHIATAISSEYRPEQVRLFLRESGIPLGRVPLPQEVGQDDVEGVLAALDAWGSEGRRVLRQFIGQWLDDELISGPMDDVRSTIIEQLARGGWHVRDGNLVVGDRAAGRRVTSPLLRDARLAALHPRIAEVAEKLLRDGHPESAVFEAVKAVTSRVRQMTGLDLDGLKLMGAAFGGGAPLLRLGDLETVTGRDRQSGYNFLFMGLVQAIRNPAAHALFGGIDENEGVEQLNLASLLMRRLDEVPAPPPSA